VALDSNRSGQRSQAPAREDDFFVAYAFGGAINAESGTDMTITHSSFSHNQAIGGNNATATGTDIIGVGGGRGRASHQ
jgi:hypothetical protein